MYSVGNNDGDCIINLIVEGGVKFCDCDGKVYVDNIIPTAYSDIDYQKKWDEFIDEVKKLDDVLIFERLDCGECVQFGDLIISKE